MKSNTWKPVSLEEVIDINPRTTLKRGTLAKKVAMEHVKEFTRKIAGFEISDFKSGSKFKNGDTLFARITPCLENGKTAFVDVLDDSEVAFGSTEFFVLRAKKDHSDPKYIYYLSISDEFRNTAIQSMTGTSGRQRAQRESLLEYEINLPSLNEQKKIGETLSLFDEKIELNNSVISNLEELAQTLFKRWFVDFEFPNENGEPYKSSDGKMIESELGMIPEGWGVLELEDLAPHSKKSFNPIKEKSTYLAHFSFPSFDEKKYPDIEDSKTIKSNKYFIDHNSIMFSRMNPKTPRIWIPSIIEDLINVCSSEFIVLDTSKYHNKSFIYNLVLSEDFNSYLISNATGSTNSRQRIRPAIAMSYKLAANLDIIKKFEKKAKHIAQKIIISRKENNSLEELRDTLLPKLLSGEIELPEPMEVTDDVPIS